MTSVRRAGIFTIAVAFTTLLGSEALFARTWTDDTGKFKVDAEFVGVVDGKVQLKKASDGKVIEVPLDRLSAGDQRLARLLATSKKSGDAPAGNSSTPNTTSESPSAGQSKFALQGLPADQYFMKLQDAAKQGDFEVVWDALPPNYQKDVEEVVHLFGKNMDPQIWNSTTNILKKVAGVLKTKKQFILGHPLIQSQIAAKDESFERQWDAGVGAFDAMTKSPLFDLKKLEQINIRTALKDLKGKVPVTSTPGNDQKIELVKEDGDTATIRIQAGPIVKEQDMIRVDGRWLNKEMVVGWDDGIKKAKMAIQSMSTPEFKQSKPTILLMIAAVDGMVQQLQAAQSQEDFNAAIDGIMQAAMAQAGGGQGLGPPGGAPGAGRPGGAPGFAPPGGPPRGGPPGQRPQ